VRDPLDPETPEPLVGEELEGRLQDRRVGILVSWSAVTRTAVCDRPGSEAGAAGGSLDTRQAASSDYAAG
jgi:hypothetical protein